ncbi:MAG: CBS domain-containing protein [Umezawaea sp.]
MRAEDIMSSPVVKVRPETPAKAATALLAAHGFTALPVVDQDDRLLGIVTEADLMRDRILPDPRAHIWRDREPIAHPHAPDTVERVMSTPAIGMTRHTDAAELAKVMLRDDVRSIPILDGQRVVGIVTRRDLLRTIARDDLAIVADVRHQLAAYAGGDRWTVTVADGVVRILDEFDDDTDRHVATVLARAVPGVQAVEVTVRADQSV